MNQQEKTGIEQLHEDVTDIRASMANMKTEIALLKQSNEKVIEPALVEIGRKLDHLSYVTVAEFEQYKKEASKRSWKENTISATFGALLTSVVAFIVFYIIEGSAR